MHPPRILPFVFVAFFLTQAFAQNSKIDSVKLLLPKLSNDSNKVKTLVFIASEYRKLGDSLALPYAREAYSLAAELKYYKGQASAATQLGRYMRQLTRRDEALKYFQESIDISEKLGRLNGVAVGHLNMGTIYYDQSKYELARESFKKSLTFYEKDNDKAGVALASGNIGITYEGEGNYAKALDAYLAALKMNEEINNKQGMTYNFGSIAINYSKQGDHKKSIEFHEKALAFYLENDRYGAAVTYVNMGVAYTKMKEYTKALEVLNKALLSFQQMRSVGVQAQTLHSIGQVYLKQGDVTAAASYFRRALRLRSKGDDSGNTVDFASLSETYVKMGKADSAVFFAKQGLAFTDRIKEIETILHINRAAYEAYKLKGDARNALLYYEKYVVNKDSTFNKETNAKYRELQIKYETEKKEQEIAILNNENALQESKFNNRVLLLSLSVAVTLGVITFLFITIRSTRRRQETERLLLNEQLLNKKIEAAKLHELDELKSRFFSNIAHEFRTPLTLISGPVENLLEENKDKHSKDQLMLVKNNSARLLALINQLLDLSKLESGVTKLDLQKDNIVRFLKGLTFSFQSLADDEEITLAYDTSEDACTMDFDRDALEKVMNNLLSNAFKFTPDLGSVKVSTARVNRDGNDCLEIKVTDSGIGITEEQLPFVFNRFYQADNVRTYSQGSGIGLALTKELVELHGGTISVTSSPGVGTVFTVSLPVRDDADVKMSAPEAAKEILREFDRQPENREEQELIVHDAENEEIVLVIEDNQDVRHFIIDSLKNRYHLISAVDGDEGIAKARETVPDLIVSDVMMPGKNGYDTCGILKRDERTSHIPVILLTAKAGLESKIEGLETGADDFIAKPFSTRELQARIKNLITTRKKLREKYLDTALSDQRPGDTLEDAFLIKIKEAVEARLDDSEFSVEDLCREIGMSRTQVHRKLKALTNQSATQFIRILKLQHGKKLLQQGKYNVSEVADRVGFASLTYFSSSYTSHFGYAPSEEKAKRV